MGLSMEIDLIGFRRIRQGERVEDVSVSLPAGRTGLGPHVALAEPATVAVHLVGDAEFVRAEIIAALLLRCPCDRCLDDVTLQLPVHFVEEWRLARVSRPGRNARPEGGVDGAPIVDVATGDQDDEMIVRRTLADVSVHLDDAFWQNAALGLATKVLCAESCRGLCPRCGANLNRTPCACREPAPDPRLEALGNWRPETRR